MPIEEIVVTARRQKGATSGPSAGDVRRGLETRGLRGGGGVGPRVAKQLDDLLARNVAQQEIAKKTGQTIEEIVVKGVRTVRRVPIGLLGSGLTGGFQLGAWIADEVSRKRLEESYRIFQGIKPRPKDSPVATIQPPPPIPEIIVTAKRPPAPRPTQPRMPTMFPETFSRPSIEMAPRPKKPAKPVVPAPKLPKVLLPGATILPFDLASPGRQPGRRREPSARPGTRSFRLGIGRPDTGFRDPLTPRLTTPQGVPVPLSDPRLATGGCPPCPKKKDKPRTRCYRQLVKQARLERNDKISKWAEINCRTGKTIKELI